MSELTYELYLMNVPFNSDYKHIVYFGNNASAITNQTNTFIARANNNGYHFENLNVIVKNREFIIKGTTTNFDKCNYMMFKSSNDTRWYYAFIDEVLYDTYKGTTIHHTLDVWQTYHTSAKFNNCFIERGHIRKSDDDIGRWIAPEPIGFGADFETEHDIFDNTLWQPYLVIESLSMPIIQPPVPVTKETLKPIGVTGASTTSKFVISNVDFSKFLYGGVGTGINVTGYFRIHPYDSYIRNCLNLWQLPEYTDLIKRNIDDDGVPEEFIGNQTENHMSDIISFTFVPFFILGTTTPSTTQLSGVDDNGNRVTVGDVLTSSRNHSQTDTVNINNNHLGCFNGYDENDNPNYYRPENNKLYTSLARCFKIYNKNGVSIPLRPELLNNLNQIVLTMYMHTYGNEIKLEINYNDFNNNFISLPYSYSFNYGINNNVGVARDTRIAQYQTNRSIANLKYLSKGMGIISNIGTSALTFGAGSMIPSSMNLQPYMNMKSQISGFSGMASVPSQIMDLAGDIVSTEFDLSVERANAYTSQPINIGNITGDRNEINPIFTQLKLAECNPTYYECQIIDNFLNMYGYSIQEIDSVKDYLTHRSKWNYIKTKDCRCNTKSPNKDNIAFNKIFDSGTTVWRNIDDVGDYTLQNN